MEPRRPPPPGRGGGPRGVRLSPAGLPPAHRARGSALRRRPVGLSAAVPASVRGRRLPARAPCGSRRNRSGGGTKGAGSNRDKGTEKRGERRERRTRERGNGALIHHFADVGKMVLCLRRAVSVATDRRTEREQYRCDGTALYSPVLYFFARRFRRSIFAASRRSAIA